MLYSALREAVSSITISYYRVAGHDKKQIDAAIVRPLPDIPHLSLLA
jgi:hypothetical protein